jgi:threonine/homoserine/homoserine lactone efflux protein
MISISGVLSPGPMTAAVIQQGSRSKLTGVHIALGHGVVEMPLIFFIFLGASSLFKLEWIRILIGLAGGLYLLYMAKDLLMPSKIREDKENDKVPSSFYSGILLSIGNPYFLLWWGTIGAGLVISSLKFGLAGLVLFAIFHWLCDLIWYSFLSLASFKGMEMLGTGFYKKVNILCGIVMIFYGGVFIVNSVKLLI